MVLWCCGVVVLCVCVVGGGVRALTATLPCDPLTCALLTWPALRCAKKGTPFISCWHMDDVHIWPPRSPPIHVTGGAKSKGVQEASHAMRYVS